MKIAVVLLGVLLSAPVQDRVVGLVDGKPVLESQIKGSTDSEREASLRDLFVRPAVSAYLEASRTQWQLTEPEIDQLVGAYRESLKCTPPPPGPVPPDFERMFARFIGANLKVQGFIYDNNGRGRVLFQQAGVEAFDATRNLLFRLEKEGRIVFNDPAIRHATLRYWLDGQQTGLLEAPGPETAFKLDRALVKCPGD